jgi:hypothetical protein
VDLGVGFYHEVVGGGGCGGADFLDGRVGGLNPVGLDLCHCCCVDFVPGGT